MLLVFKAVAQLLLPKLSLEETQTPLLPAMLAICTSPYPED